MTHRYAIIGDIEADVWEDTIAPAGSAAIALALAQSGGAVTLRSTVGDDDRGTAVLGILEAHGVSTALIDREHGAGTITAYRASDGTLTRRQPGAHIRKGARMDIYDLFGHDVLVLDATDQPLRRFLSDLPAHTAPSVRMLGTLRHLDTQQPTGDELEIAMRFDTIVGTGPHLMMLTAAGNAADALMRLHTAMPGTHLRTAVAALPDAIEIVTREEGRRVELPYAAQRLIGIIAGTARLMASHESIALLGATGLPR